MKQRKLFSFFALLFTASILFTACDNDNEKQTTPVSVQSVSLTPSEISIVEGAPAVSLTATIAPTNATNRAVTWSSNNIRVATVDDNGAVTARSIGTATITVTTADGERTATATVTVTPAPIPVTDVMLNHSTLELVVGASETLTATVLPANATNRSITWASSNNAVATVDDNGRITAHTAGTATITVTTKDGGRTATCVVTVPAPIPVTGVTINPNTLNLAMGTSETLTATIIPANAANRAVTWASNNTAVATVNTNGKVTAVSAGTATITVTTEDGEHTAACTVMVVDIPDSPDGVVINGVRWATRNLGAATATCMGGRRTWSNSVCPEGWRLPSQDEFTLLLASGVQWIHINGRYGRLYGTAPYQIFLPAGGRWDGRRVVDDNIRGYYWTNRDRAHSPHNSPGPSLSEWRFALRFARTTEQIVPIETYRYACSATGHNCRWMNMWNELTARCVGVE